MRAYAHSSSRIVRACESYVDSCSSATDGMKSAEHAPVVSGSDAHDTLVILLDRLYEFVWYFCEAAARACRDIACTHRPAVTRGRSGNIRRCRHRGKAASSLHLSLSLCPLLLCLSLSLSTSSPPSSLCSQLHARSTSLARSLSMCTFARCVVRACTYLRCTDTRDKRVAAAACFSRVCVRTVRSVFAVSYFCVYARTRAHTAICTRGVCHRNSQNALHEF